MLRECTCCNRFQVFNHVAYHRGQLVNMLRQLGLEKIPPTDFNNVKQEEVNQFHFKS